MIPRMYFVQGVQFLRSKSGKTGRMDESTFGEPIRNQKFEKRRGLKQRAAKNDAGNCKVDNEAGNVDECSDEGCRGAGGVQPKTTQDKRQHRSGDGPE